LHNEPSCEETENIRSERYVKWSLYCTDVHEIKFSGHVVE